MILYEDVPILVYWVWPMSGFVDSSFKFKGRRRGGVVVVKNVCGKCKVFPVSDWNDLRSTSADAGEFLENDLRDEMWNEMCMHCNELLKCRFARGLPNSPFDVYRVSHDKVVRL